jgi:hypothetical protein
MLIEKKQQQGAVDCDIEGYLDKPCIDLQTYLDKPLISILRKKEDKKFIQMCGEIQCLSTHPAT